MKERTAYLMAVAASDTADFCIRIMERSLNRANAFGTGLGGPEGPEPDKPSPRFARHPISQGEKK